MKDRLLENKTDPAIVVELVDSVVKPLMVISDELIDVRKGLSRIQKDFENLTYQSVAVREQLELDSKALTKERAALEVLGKKFIANLADLESLTGTLSKEVRQGITSASKTLANAISNDVYQSVQQTVDVSAGALSETVQKNIQLLNSRENSVFWSNVNCILTSVVCALVIMLCTFYYFKKHITHLPCLNTCICEVVEPKDIGKNKQPQPKNE